MPLPAPYAPPWKRLGEDGVALVAWLGLKVRELWRRNGEGSLPAPAFWPRPWLRLFWPLVLAGALILLVTFGRVWLASPPDSGAASLAQAEQAGTNPGDGREPVDSADPAGDVSHALAELGEAPAIEAAPAPRQRRDAAPSDSEGGAPAGTESDGPPGSQGNGPPLPEDAAASTGPLAPDGPEPSTSESVATPAEVEANRLRALWSEEDRDGLIAVFRPDPAALTLTLQLYPAFQALPATKRERLAERWHQRAIAAGYGHLRLRDGQRRLLGRDALVGSGVVLFAPPGALDEAP